MTTSLENFRTVTAVALVWDSELGEWVYETIQKKLTDDEAARQKKRADLLIDICQKLRELKCLTRL